MSSYSVPHESAKLLEHGIIHNPLHHGLKGSEPLPAEISETLPYVKYEGSDLPLIPINWRFAESLASLKGFQACMLNVLLKRKYGMDYQEIVINTNHAQLFFQSLLTIVVDPDGDAITNIMFDDVHIAKYFPVLEKNGAFIGAYNAFCTNIYRAGDGRYFHLHGDINPTKAQQALGLSPSLSVSNSNEARNIYAEKVSTFTGEELETLMNDKHGVSGTVCHSTEEYLSSEHGKANAHAGLYELFHIPNPKQPPTWWDAVDNRDADPRRPLFGLKVIDLTRIIAGATIGRELAELGASILRITSPNVTDISSINIDVGWGKWNAYLDLKKEEDREQLRGLMLESDVVIDGYRPHIMEKWGFGKDDVLRMCEGRKKGIVYAREDCYGWNGPYSGRSGWQQISDGACGVSLKFGRAMGVDEPVTPVFPNSDCCTGISGATGILHALIQRAEKGGSYVVDVALNYYSQWLVRSCGTYPVDVWDDLWTRYGKPVFHHDDNMQITIPAFLKMLKDKAPELYDESYFEKRHSVPLGVDLRVVKPILGFPGNRVSLGYNVGVRPNGVDEPRWPENLLSENIC
ncbi:hypothetical protein D9758_016258 [Tetrapyrgos nigripes]|uniref:Uncharacterized protein n=1 Tax=Tetrapyrgos nigripes TaxID=182062 RepID=A0A8H5FCJ8_9AGAR|nr:hypothetical protein D9758_016258 [Tetrapyrgos nigripes]